MVQHNHIGVPSSSTPGGATTAGGGSTGRPLPYPPIVAEAELFHPRPRMGLGVGGLAGGLEDGLDKDGGQVKGGGGGGGDESAYYSALETQTESVDSESGKGTMGGSEEEESTVVRSGTLGSNEPGFGTEATGKRDNIPEKVAEAEEPTIQDLLLAQPQAASQSHSISGVEAWEMELGETVKRISNSSAAGGAGGGGGGGDTTSLKMSVGGGGSKTRTRPRKREMVMGEIGRKSGRAGAGLEGGRKRITGVLDPELFEAPDDGPDGGFVDGNELKAGSIPVPDSSASTFASASAPVPASTSAFILGESVLDERESTIVERESSLDIRESSVAERESAVNERESCLDCRESSITQRESTITTTDNTSGEIQQRIFAVEKRELDADKRESEVEKRERDVSEREIKVERREEEVKEGYQGKLVEVERVLLKVPVVDVAPPIAITSTSNSTLASSTCTSKSGWSASPIDFARRLCTTFLLPMLGGEGTPGSGDDGSNRVDECASSSNSSSTTATTTSISTPPASSSTSPRPITPPPPLVASWSVQRGFFLNRVLGSGGSYVVLMSIGICVVLLRGIVRKILAVGRR